MLLGCEWRRGAEYTKNYTSPNPGGDFSVT